MISCTECMLHCLFVLPLGRLQSGLHFKYCAANPHNISSEYSPLAVGGLTCLKNFLRIRHQKYFTHIELLSTHDVHNLKGLEQWVQAIEDFTNR